MKCSSRNLQLIFVFWNLKQLLFPEVYAESPGDNQKDDWYVLEKGSIKLTEPETLKIFKRNEDPYIMVKGSSRVLNSTILRHFTPNNLTGFSSTVLDVFPVPDGLFGFPAVVVSLSGTVSARSSDLDCKMALADISDFQKPKQYDIIPDENVVVKDFVSLTWTSNKDLLVCRSYDDKSSPKEDLMYYRRKKGSETQLWEGHRVAFIYVVKMVMFKNIWRSFDALYACDYASKSLVLMWPEDGEEKAGDWGNPDHLKKRVLEKNDGYRNLLLVDVNKDGRLELLVSNVDNEVWLIGIPTSEDFKNPANYKSQKLIAGEDNACPNVIQVFYPYAKYESKPWIISGGYCGAFYFIPRNNEASNLSYLMFEIPIASQVTGVEAVDIDYDSFTELFISLHDVNVVKVYSFTKLNSMFPDLTPGRAEFSKCSSFTNLTPVTLAFTFLVNYVTIPSSHNLERFLNSII